VAARRPSKPRKSCPIHNHAKRFEKIVHERLSKARINVEIRDQDRDLPRRTHTGFDLQQRVTVIQERIERVFGVSNTITSTAISR